MYLKKVIIGALFSAVFFSTVTVSSQAASTKYVTSSTLEIRKKATSSSKSVGHYKKGDEVLVCKVTGNWAKIKKNKKYYYVYAKYLSAKKKKTAKAARMTKSGKSVVQYAKKFIGNPYRYGGTSLTKGTDCSGFTKSVYKHFGISLPHSSSAQRRVGHKVSWGNKKPGDIICYSGHVAIYIGNNKIIHASNPRSGIKISKYIKYRSVLCVRRVLS